MNKQKTRFFSKLTGRFVLYNLNREEGETINKAMDIIFREETLLEEKVKELRGMRL